MFVDGVLNLGKGGFHLIEVSVHLVMHGIKLVVDVVDPHGTDSSTCPRHALTRSRYIYIYVEVYVVGLEFYTLSHLKG